MKKIKSIRYFGPIDIKYNRKAEAIQSPITFWYGKYIILIPSSYF